MAELIDAFKRDKYLYVVVLSVITTVLLISESLDFAERVLANKLLLVFSVLVFVFLFNIAVNARIWVG